MALTKSEVEHIAKLARLGLTEEEKTKFASQLSSILNYVEQLGSVDTDGIEPTAQVTGLENIYRLDQIEDCDSQTQQKLIASAPASEDNLIKTKSVF
ncbi:MAG: Asp-tRNA(Asn)/Glu-tRNA(Gln) amidotransferase subunit GatC [Patescibacteria group bacterium]|nr:Asp-tRNA(Asn)/Glu-tRNA(Gln) amidotransferase subunit GatC [Patescibacteria group bacterium]